MRMFMHSHGHRLVGQIHDNLEDIQPGLSLKVFGGVVVGAAVSYVAVRGYLYYRSRQIGKERGAAARKACQSLKDRLNQLGRVNKEKEAMIVGLGMKNLQEKLRKGELKAVEVLRAYQRKALEVNDRLNCITEPIVEAEAWAKELDLLRPEQRGPLHGIPISIKDSILIKGYDCNIGFSCFVGKPPEKDGEIVQLLKSLGAVPFVRTNFPQGLLTYACSNPMYGETHNPHDLLRGPGGSSGGEGALLGGGGSVIGIGSDIGGSVRIPATMCGVWSLKPTVKRFLWKGHIPVIAGQQAVLPIHGPMTRDMDGLIQMSRALFTPRLHDYDPTIAPYSFREEVFESKRPLRVGFYTGIDKVPAHPTCVRAVLEAKAILEQKGYQVVQFDPPRAYDAFCDLWMRGIFGDDGEEGNGYMKDDVVDGCISSAYYMGQLPMLFQYIISKLTAVVDPLASQMSLARYRIPRTVSDWWKLIENIQEYKMEFLRAWKDLDLDAVICPVMPFPAVTAGYEATVFYGIVYTALYNLVDYPAGVLPVSTVTEKDIHSLKDPSVFPRSGLYEKSLVKDSEGSVGLPVGVQCVSLPFEEEIVLRVMKDIDTAIRK